MRVAVDHDRKLGESSVLRCLIDVWRSGSTRDEVPARAIQHEAGRVGGGEFDAVGGVAGVDRWPSVIMKCLDRLGEQFANQRIGKETPLGLLQGREVRRLVQSQLFTPQPPVLENRDDPAVIGAEELAQHEAGEELGELKIVATVSIPIPSGYRGNVLSPMANATAATFRGDLQAVLIPFPSAQHGAFLQGRSGVVSQKQRLLTIQPRFGETTPDPFFLPFFSRATFAGGVDVNGARSAPPIE